MLHIVTQQELQKLTKILPKSLFKDIKFPVKVRDTQKIEKQKSIYISVLVMKIRKRSNICIKKVF